MKSPEAPKEKALPAYINMYEVPGQDKITPHSFLRYQEDKKRDEETIRGLVSLLQINIQDIPKDKRAHFIRQCLEHSNPKTQEMGARMIECAPEDEQAPLIRQCLGHSNPEIQRIGAWRIVYVSEHNEQERLGKLATEKIREGLESADPEVQERWAWMILYAPKNKREDLIKIVTEKIREGLESADPEVQERWARMILYAPENERGGLREIVAQKIRKELESAEPEMQKIETWMAAYVSDDERDTLTKQCLEHPNPKTQEMGARMIGCTLFNERATSLIRQCLKHSNPKVQETGAWMIEEFVPDNRQEDLRKIVSKKIKERFESTDPEVQKTGAWMIECAPKDEREKLFDLAVEKKLEKYLIEPPLYRRHDNMDAESFSRAKFDKDGSETILVGGKLKGKEIIRTIEPLAFLAWQKSYEDYKSWQDANFDHVPVEPIVSFRINKNGGLVDVHSEVLDLNLKQWTNKTDKFSPELKEAKRKILEVLEKQHIHHGHPDDNFCLRFFRQENGEPDFSRPPRLYLIDFDRAIIIGN